MKPPERSPRRDPAYQKMLDEMKKHNAKHENPALVKFHLIVLGLPLLFVMGIKWGWWL